MTDRKTLLKLFDEQADAWQKRAADGIEQYRKGDATLTLRDQSGAPIQNARIKVTQRAHEFRFGVNLFLLDELESARKNEQYKQYISETFNMATLPFYWNATEPECGKTRYAKDSVPMYRRPAIDRCIEFCAQHGIEPREHGLAYEQFFPTWLYGAETAEVKRALERRYAEIAERYANRIHTIEVTNEMEWKKGRTPFYDEPDYVEWCFKLAEKYFPHNQLVINEHTACPWIDRCRSTDKYYAYIEANLLKGARIDAIGMQFHIMKSREQECELAQYLYNPESLYRHMDLYARLGKPLQVTEVTIPAFSGDPEDEAVQAELLKRLYTVWFSHPNMEQIVYWNLVDGYAHLWDPSPERIRASQGDMTLGENVARGGLVRFDMTPKPAFLALKELIEREWHTEEQLVTDADGHADFRGFYGTYDVETEVDGRIQAHTVKLSKKTDNRFILTV